MQETEHKKNLLLYLSKLEEAIADGVGVLIFGDPGTGKTAMASIIMQRVAQLNMTGYFIDGRDVHEAWNRDIPFSDDLSLRQHISSVAVLVIDDLVIYPKGFVSGNMLVESAIRNRIHNKLPTIITTNFQTKDFDKSWAIMSSLFEESMFFIECTGKDYRKEAQGKIKQMFREKA